MKSVRILRWLPLLFVLILTACSQQTSGVNAEGNVVVELFNQKPEITQQLEEVATEFETENPGTDIIITTIGSGEGAAGLQSKFTSGNPPAIMMLGGTSEIDRYSDTLDTMDDLEMTETILPNLIEGGEVEGELLALPMSIEGFGFMYNKAIFEQAGINVDDIQTYDDFVSAVETLDDQKEALGIQEVFGFSGGEDYIVNQFSVNFTSPEYNHNMLAAYESDNLSWEYGDQMHKYTDLINQYNVQPILTVNYSQSVEQLFVNDEVAMIHQGNWIVPTLNGLDPEFVQDKLGILPVFGENDETGKIVAGAPWYWGVNKEMAPEVIDVSKQFLDFLYLSETGQQIIVEEMNMIPPQAGYDVEQITDPVSQDIYEEILAGDNAAMMHKIYPDGWFQLVLYPEFQRYLDGQSTWEEFEEITAQSFKEMR